MPGIVVNMESWLCSELAKLDIDISLENASYILTIEGEADIKEYMFGLLDQNNAKCRTFVKELIRRKDHPNITPPYRSLASNDVTVYQKHKEEDLVSPVRNKSTKISPSSKRNKEKQPTSDDDDISQRELSLKDGTKKKSRFVPLYSEEGQKQAVVKLKGRHECECQATKHKLINNCLNCGRVVCEQEGSGPCMFCNNLVCTNDEWEILSRNNKKSEKLRNVLENLGGGGKVVTKREATKGQVTATQYKDRMLEYDRTSAKRTQVIDDQSDYFSLDSKWLSPQQRELTENREREHREKQHASRRSQKITLDFAGRRVLEVTDDVSGYREGPSSDQEVRRDGKAKSSTAAYMESLASPTLGDITPVYIAPDGSYSSKLSTDPVPAMRDEGQRSADDPRVNLRLQDRELREMCDLGVCLSMHQPWASLLVAGVKVHEGRTWYTAHRGRLWIAATAKQASQGDIDQVIQSYHYICTNDRVRFPANYPVACLLGCVDVIDCVDQDTYVQKFPEGESMSPYVLICDNPQTLLVKFPIKGQHKIYKLDKHIHQAAKRGIAAAVS